MAKTQEIEFRASDLIGPAGVGSNGERLVNSLVDHYPPALQAALLKRINPVLDDKLDDAAYRAISRIAGVDRVDGAHVRGGFGRTESATVTYAFLDDRGQVWKGCFPHEHLSGGSSDAHVSQRDSLAASAIAQEHLAANPPGASAGEIAGPPAPERDPFDVLEGASAGELVEMMREHPERAELVKGFERAHRGDRARKSVLDFDPQAEAQGTGDGEASGAGGGTASA